MPPKAPITCNWMKSSVTEETLANFVKSGYLPKKEVMSYRAPDPSEERPQPRDGEVVIFADHMSRGFAPPGSKFFRDVLNFFDLRPQDIGPNSISNICNFQVFCDISWRRAESAALQRAVLFEPPNRVRKRSKSRVRRHLHPTAQGLSVPLRRTAKSPQGLESDVVLLPRHVAG